MGMLIHNVLVLLRNKMPCYFLSIPFIGFGNIYNYGRNRITGLNLLLKKARMRGAYLFSALFLVMK